MVVATVAFSWNSFNVELASDSLLSSEGGRIAAPLSQPVAEPAALVLLATGLASLATLRGRRW
jgi:hypothetical protein